MQRERVRRVTEGATVNLYSILVTTSGRPALGNMHVLRYDRKFRLSGLSCESGTLPIV